jgi:hypothetical protein
MTDTMPAIEQAVRRGLRLCEVLDNEHTVTDVHRVLRSIRHELRTAHEALQKAGANVVAPRGGQHRGDAPATSRAAAAAIRTKSGGQRHALLKLLAEVGPLADFEMQAQLNIGGSSQRPRRVELHQAGYVAPLTNEEGDSDPDLVNGRDIVTRINPDSGLACELWRVTGLGRVALRQLDAGHMVQATLFDIPGGGERHG